MAIEIDTEKVFTKFDITFSTCCSSPSGFTMLTLSSGHLLSQGSCHLSPAAITIIYLDLISHHEMFPDIYKFLEIESGLCLEVEGKMVSRTEGNTDGNVLCCTVLSVP